MKYAGKEQITQVLDGQSKSIDADVYTWAFGLGKYFAYTTGGSVSDTNNTATLHRWVVSAEGNNYTSEYYNLTAVPEAEQAAFEKSFEVPEICNNAPSCDGAFKQGLLKPEHLEFLRAGN